MLTLDGLQLLGDNQFGELGDFLNKLIPLESFMPWMSPVFARAGLEMITTPTGVYPYKQAKVNRLIWPTSASRFAFGHFLCDSTTLASIMADAYSYNDDESFNSYNYIPLAMGNPESNTSGTIIPAEQFVANMYLLPPTPLSAIRGLPSSDIEQENTTSLYLLTLVDQRYFWWFKNTGDMSSFMSAQTTWQNMFDYFLGTQLGMSLANYSIDYINPAYLQPSIQMFSLQYEPIAPVLDAVCQNIGHRLVCNFDGSVSTQLEVTAIALLNADMANSVDSDGNPTRNPLAGGQRLNPVL